MDNVNLATSKAEPPHPLLEAIIKLAHSGSSPEAISFALGLDIEMVKQVITTDPKLMAKVVEAIQEKSREYRCVLSHRLMLSPVMARDENYYEQSILEANPSLSREQVLPSLKLKAKIAEFSKESLKALEGYLKQRTPQEATLDLTAECLSVLSL